MTYNANFFEILEIQSCNSPDELREVLVTQDISQISFGMDSLSVIDFLAENFNTEINFEFKTIEPNATFFNDIAFHEAFQDGNAAASAVIIELRKISSIESSPTEILKHLLLYSAITGDFDFPVYKNENDLPPFQTEKGNVIFFWFSATERQKEVLKYIYAPEKNRNIVFANYRNDSIIKINQNGSYTRQKDLKMLSMAMSEENLKWRFLMLYRIFENGYLSSILEELTSSFFARPKDAINSAADQIKSELTQFSSLVERCNLNAHFEQIQTTAHRLRGTNSFISAISTKLDSVGRGYPNFKKGVFIAYQFRCAIVHAGEKEFFYDQYPDAEDALVKIHDSFDRAVFDYLGFKFS